MSPLTPPLERDPVADWQEILADIERCVAAARTRMNGLAELAQGFRLAYGTRDALLRASRTGAAPHLSPLAIATVLTEHAEALSRGDEYAAALGCMFVSLATELDVQPRDHSQRVLIEGLRRRMAAILDLVGPEVAEARAETIKGVVVNTTRH